MKSYLLNHVVWNWEKVRFFWMTPRFAALSFKRPACASDDAFTPVWKAFFALRLGISLEQSKQLHIAHVLNHFLGIHTERVVDCSVVDLVDEIIGEVILDLLDKFTNTIVVSLFHNRMWQSTNSEVDVILVYHWLLVVCVTNHGKQRFLLRSIMVCFIFHIEVRAKRSRQTSVPFYHDLGLSLVGLVVILWIVEQLIHLFVEQLLNPIISSNHVARKSLEEDEVTQKTFSFTTSQVSIRTTFGIQ